jgi:hypothetical protein
MIDIKHQQSTVTAASGVHAYSNWNSTWPWVGWRLSANQSKHPTPMTFKYARLVHITNSPANVANTSQNQYIVAGQIVNILTQLYPRKLCGYTAPKAAAIFRHYDPASWLQLYTMETCMLGSKSLYPMNCPHPKPIKDSTVERMFV